MRIGFVVNQLALGGGERQAADVAGALAARGHDCTVFYFYGKDLLRPELEAHGIRVVALDAGRSYWRGVRPLARALRALRIEVVNTHMPLSGTFGRIAAWLARLPVVSTEQDRCDAYPLKVRLANELTLNGARAIVCVSKEVRRSLYRRTNPYLLRRANTRVIYNTVDLERLHDLRGSRDEIRSSLALAPDDVVIVNVGRYNLQKGQTYLLQALPLVLHEEPRVKLVLVGWGPLEERLRSEVAELGVEDEVVFAVERPDAGAIIAASDIFAFPSLYEGLGIALLEAMALERPCVASAIAPLTEVVRHGVDGLLVEPRDPSLLAEALLRLIADPAFASELARNARSRVETHFALPEAADAYEAVLSEAVA
jgi:glycosyltransferase involved in cell wall biosynthesis